MPVYRPLITAKAKYSISDTIPAMSAQSASAQADPGSLLGFTSIDPRITLLNSHNYYDVVSLHYGCRCRGFEGYNFDIEIEVTIETLWSLIVDACSNKDAEQTAMCIFKQAMAIVPMNDRSRFEFESKDLNVAYRIKKSQPEVLDECLVASCYLCECDLQREIELRQKAIARIYGLSIPEIFFCFHDYSNRESSLQERIAVVMDSRWRAHQW